MVDVANGYPLGGVLYTITVVFVGVIFIYLLVTVFIDLFGRDDISGWGKAGWTIVVVFLPFVGILAYMVSQGKSMAARRTGKRSPGVVSFDDNELDRPRPVSIPRQSATNIDEAQQLLDSGAITPEEFEALKRKARAQ